MAADVDVRPERMRAAGTDWRRLKHPVCPTPALSAVPAQAGDRQAFDHNGSVATLEDWFNPARTNDTYVPTGWRGPPGTESRAVKGHEYGLDLSEEDRKALIAFLRTL